MLRMKLELLLTALSLLTLATEVHVMYDAQDDDVYRYYNNMFLFIIHLYRPFSLDYQKPL